MTDAPLTQRDRLRARALPTRDVHLPRDPVAHQAAVDEFTGALSALQLVGRGADRDAAADRVLAARESLDRHSGDVESFRLRCLAPPDWEALLAAHPPTDEQAGAGLAWNPSMFRPACLAACVVAPDGEPAYTEGDWREFARDGRVSAGEQDLLVATAVALNTRAVQLAVGKGSAPTPS